MLGTSRELGQLRFSYRPPKRFFVLSGLNLLLLIVIFGGIFLGVMLQGRARPGLSPDAIAPLTLFALPLLGALAGVGLWIRLLSYRVDLHERGLRIHHGAKRIDELAFDEVVSLRSHESTVTVNGVPLGNISTAFLRTRAAGTVKIVGRGMGFDISSVIRAVERSTYEQRRTAIEDQLHAGGRVNLGALTLTLHALTYKRRAVRWTELGELQVDRGFLRIFPRMRALGPPIVFRRASLWDADVVTVMVQQHAKGLAPADRLTFQRGIKWRAAGAFTAFLFGLGALLLGVMWYKATVGLELGHPCRGSAGCRNHDLFTQAVCVPDQSSGSSYCSYKCDDDSTCPSFWTCQNLSWSGRVVGVCERP
jgi:hypothetical protein